jgi:hypothetical protein
MRLTRYLGRWTATVTLVSLALTACGGPSASSSVTPVSGPASGAPGFPVNAADMTKVRACLEAAGIALPSPPAGIPSGFPSGMPSFDPNQPLPSGFPPPDDGGFMSPKVRQALDACGITLPSPGPGG